jgi:hypothetical protein
MPRVPKSYDSLLPTHWEFSMTYIYSSHCSISVVIYNEGQPGNNPLAQEQIDEQIWRLPRTASLDALAKQLIQAATPFYLTGHDGVSSVSCATAQIRNTPTPLVSTKSRAESG